MKKIEFNGKYAVEIDHKNPNIAREMPDEETPAQKVNTWAWLIAAILLLCLIGWLDANVW